MSSKLRPPPEPELAIPPELSLPLEHPLEIKDWHALVPGQLVELSDGQQVLLLTVEKTGAEPAVALEMVRVKSPRDAVHPLGLTLTMTPSEALAETMNGPLKVLGAWYPAERVPVAERVVIEAIRRGFITKRTCGVPWPLGPSWQLSEQAAGQIERYLFEVARTTGCAFPFHDITAAMRTIHLRISAESSSLCDIITGETLGRFPRTDDELLSLWARALQRAIHATDLSVPDPIALTRAPASGTDP